MKLRVSQDVFDSTVRENVEEFEMDMEEALADAVHTYQLQGVDLTGIITDCRTRTDKHPVVEAIEILDAANAAQEVNFEHITEALNALSILCAEEGLGNATIAGQHGGMEKILSSYRLCSGRRGNESLPAVLKALIPLLSDGLSKRDFISCGGPETIVNALMEDDIMEDVAEVGATAVTAAVTADEILKEKFMDLKVDEVLINLIKRFLTSSATLETICSALRALSTADDDRVIASNAFKYARKLAKQGAIEALLEATRHAHADGNPSLLAILCGTIKTLAVNDEICKAISEERGIELTMQFMDASMRSLKRDLAKSSCSLLAQLAGSDSNKDEIVAVGGMEKLMTMASCYSDDGCVLQEVMNAVGCLSLRSPGNASRAVEAGAVDVAAEAMERFEGAANVQKSACQMLRNLAVRNPENRPLMIERGLEELIRNAKSRHMSCKQYASAALRDLGFDDYL